MERETGHRTISAGSRDGSGQEKGSKRKEASHILTVALSPRIHSQKGTASECQKPIRDGIYSFWKHHRKKENTMSKKVGLWINRNKAVIVSIANNTEARRIITSDMEHYVLYSDVVPGDGSPENARDKRYWNHLGEY